MTDVAAAMGVSDIELNDVPDMRQDQKEIDAPAHDDTAPLVALGVLQLPILDVSAAQTRARDTVDAVSRVAWAAAELRAVEEQYARGLKNVASTLEGAAGPGKGVRSACAAAAAMLTSASEAHATLAKSLAADVEAPLEQSRTAVRKTSVRRRRARPSRPPRRQGGRRPLPAGGVEAQSPRAGRDRDRSRETGARRGLGPRQRRRRASAGEAARVDLRQIPRADEAVHGRR